MADRTERGEWRSPSEAGGCPKHKSWPQNPQYLLRPSAPGTFSLRLTSGSTVAIGLVALHGGERRTRSKLEASEVAHKTKWKAKEAKASGLALEAAPYVLIPTTFDPHLEGAFQLSVSGSVAFTLSPMPGGAGGAASVPLPPTFGAAAPLTLAALQGAAGAGANGPAGAGGAAGIQSRLDGSVRVEVEGGGISGGRQQEAAALVAAAVAACAGGGKYEDRAFPPTAK